MSWSYEIDPAKPSDVDPVSEGDNQIRALKSALIERLVTKLVGFPDTDPLVILGVEVGLLSAKPAVPSGNGHTYFAYDTLQLFIGRGGAWIEFTGGGGTPPPPDYGSISQPTAEALTDASFCTDVTPTYRITATWTNAETAAGSQTQVYVNGVLNSTVTYPTATKTVTVPSSGDYIIGLRHLVAGELSTMITKSITLGNPCTASVHPLIGFVAVDISTCEAGPTPLYKVEFGMTHWITSAKTRIYYDGVAVLLLGAGVTAFDWVLPAGGEVGTHTFEATEVVDGVESVTRLTSTISIVNQCDAPTLRPPTGFDVYDVGSGSSVSDADMAWVSSDITMKTRIYREDITGGGGSSLLHEVIAGVQTYNDLTVVTDHTYSYYLVQYDPSGGGTESTPTASVIFIASNPPGGGE